jgi:hypothetical protein
MRLCLPLLVFLLQVATLTVARHGTLCRSSAHEEGQQHNKKNFVHHLDCIIVYSFGEEEHKYRSSNDMIK